MKLTELVAKLDGCRLLDEAPVQLDIESVEIDSRECRKGSLFACVKGYVLDGHDFAGKALERGAAALLTESPERLKEKAAAWEKGYVQGDSILWQGRLIPVIVTDNIRRDVARIADILADHPSGKLELIGITGTKGKTTTSYMMRSILTAAGRKSGLIGTICNFIGDERIPTERTTPEANVIQPLLKKMVDAGIGECVMEVSSQGLNLDRVGGCEFAVGLFTNLSPDHIGPSEHANMDEYAAAKAKLFGLSRYALVNRDNDWSEYMIARAQATVKEKLYTFGMSEGCEFRAVNVVKHPEGVEYDCLEEGEPKAHVVVPIPGRFSVYNSLGAYAAMRLIGIAPEICVEGLSTVAVAGKAEVVPTGRDFTVIIDYAHNPDSFINIITTVKEFAKRTVFLFGCGGDRNRPRALMGETAGKYADFSIITSDNPRSEDPASIVADLEAGLKPTGGEYVVIVDRREAIHWAIKHALPGDVIILAGKGHETYQILKDRTIHFDEREVVREALAEL
ncbi:MAG: UDP-N-acetylmuramoyl-L-alanyl-D-glutamate--2,6-diaminopimelate ligase [Clostridia bacterium]|nr:UDP-N-acetylmuramoyl-L-alanyl-D-glutamate--2,6-diaminopimelate ligase [Clostridia bacterium]